MKALLAVSCTLALALCGGPRPAAKDAATPAAGDTLRGRLAVVGSEPGTWVVLQMESGRRAVTLLGDRPLLTRLAGLEVVVAGAPNTSDSTFNVQRVEVRADNGVAALDGVLERPSGGDVLVTNDGRTHPIAHLPEALRGMTGARVWLAGPLDRPPDSFGIIAPAPGMTGEGRDTLQRPP